MAVPARTPEEFAVLRALGLTRWQLEPVDRRGIRIDRCSRGTARDPARLLMAWVLTAAISCLRVWLGMPFVLGATPRSGPPRRWAPAPARHGGLYPAWRASMHDPAPRLRED